MKAKPVEYVKICSLYGAGFYYIPGTDTYIRIGGHIRSEVSFNSRGTGLQSWAVGGDGNNGQTRDRDFFFVRNRIFVNTDTRTQTSFGTLRTFSVTRFETNTGTGLASGAGITAIDAGIIQWGGFTIGRAPTSYFDNPWAYAFKWGPSVGWSGNPDTAGGRFVAAYTHQFGNGISGTISVEDNKINNKRPIYNGANALTIIGPAPGVNTQGGNTWPEIVGQLRIDQAWGGFHLSGSIINNHVAYNCGGASGTTTVLAGGCSELSGNPSDKVGGAVNAAFKFNTPTGVNDALYIGGTYSKGDGGTTWGGTAQGGVMGIYGGSKLPGITYGSITGGYVWDTVYTSTAGVTAGGGNVIVGPVGQQLTTGYGGSIAFEHGWNAEWRTSIFGGAQVVDYNATANGILCSKFAAGSPSGTLTIGAVNVANTN
ncbi:MAG: porin, partial [Burkholderiales bacterium]